MKLGDMTIKQIAEICMFRDCNLCPFGNYNGNCMLLKYAPMFQDLNMEINTDGKD